MAAYGYVPTAISQMNPQYQQSMPNTGAYNPYYNYVQGRYYTQQELQQMGYTQQQTQQQPQQQQQSTNLIDIFNKSKGEAVKEGAKATATASSAPAIQAAVTGSTEAPYALQTLADGSGTLMSDGSVVAPEASMLGTLAPLAVAGLGAYTAKKSYDAYNNSRGKGFSGGVKQATKDAGALNFVPVLGQAAWLAGGLGGALGHVSPETLQRRRAQDVASKVEGGDTWYNSSIEGNPEVKAQWKSALDAASPDFVGHDSNGIWINKKFANSRDEADLRPEDIMGSAQMLETFGNDWQNKYSEDQKSRIAQALLDNKLIDERKGGIYFQKGQSDKAKEIGLAALGNTGTGLSSYANNVDLSGFNGVLKSGIGSALASTPTVQTKTGQSVADPNAGKKPGDVGYDWLAARAIRKGQYTG